MEDLKIYGLNFSAVAGVSIAEINPILSTLVLVATLVYTIIQISEKLKKKMKLKYFNTNQTLMEHEMMEPKLLTMLDELREEYGHPVVLTSHYRSPDHPIEAKKARQENMHGC